MLKQIGFLTVIGMFTVGTHTAQAQYTEQMPNIQPQPQIQQAAQPQLQMPTSIIVCRSKQCAPAKLSQSKEYIFNTLLHLFDSNARQKALVCEANAQTHSCTEEYVSVPITVGVTPAYMYIDDVKITDVSVSPQNTMALNLILNWNVTYNGQTPTCRPSKTLLHVKNVNNVLIQDNGYSCRMTTIGTTTIQTMFAIDYIDMDYGYIGGFYSIGLSGPAYGGGSGYMMLRLPNDVTIEAKDFPISEGNTFSEQATAPTNVSAPEAQTVPTPPISSPQAPVPVAQPVQIGGQYIYNAYTGQFIPLPTVPMPYAAPAAATPAAAAPAQLSPFGMTPVIDPNHVPAPNVSSIIKYNHPAKEYEEAQELARIRAEKDMKKKEHLRHELERKKQMEEEAVDFGGAKVFPLPKSPKVDKTLKQELNRNSLSDYAPTESRRFD
ncbi:MAG: hypothetical protein IJS88_06305 [Alphaproteobacteria bacterium]|nr:hypothetical protein [Alphaproteobacteria bacterium]